jgi:transcription elongation factor
MAAKPVSLAVHRNTIERRRKQTLAKELTRRTGDMVRSADIRAYAVVGIAADGSAHAIWDTGAILPMWAFAETVAHVLRVDMDNSGAKEDWRPALTPAGSKT